MKSIEEWDDKIKIQLIQDGAAAEEEDKEYAEMRRYRKNYLAARAEIDDYYSYQPENENAETASVHSSAGGEKKKKFHLPEVKLKSFSGKLKDWLGWWSQFRQIHEDHDLHAVDKFHYLVQAMEVGTEAKELVESYPMTDSNYASAVDALTERFGRPDLLLQVYIRELLTLVISNVTSPKKLPLAQLYLRLESHLRSLAELNLNQADPATWLFPLVESSLCEETLRAWQRSSQSRIDGAELTPKKTRLDLLMEFVKAEVRSNQQIELARQGFAEANMNEPKKSASKPKGIKSMDIVPTAAGLFSGSSSNCIICGVTHSSDQCPKLRSMTNEQQVAVLREKKMCFKCLQIGHIQSRCRARVKCSKCGKGHHEIVCWQRKQHQKRHADSRNQPEPKRVRFVNNPRDGDLQIVTNNSNQCSDRILLNTVKVKIEVDGGSFKTVRLVGDSASQRSFGVEKSLKDARCVTVGEEWLQTVVFGGTKTIPKCYKKKRISIMGFNGAAMSFELLEKDTITGNIREIPLGPWIRECEDKGIHLTDIGEKWTEADILIGNDYWGAIRTGRLVHLDCGLTAEETIFGWTLGGPVTIMTASVGFESAPAQNIERLWSLESLGIRDPAESLTPVEEEASALIHFNETVRRDDEGRYVVALPWKTSARDLPTNRKIAVQRLRSTTYKLSKSGEVAEYHAVFKSWEAEELISKVPDEDIGHFIPHRPIFKESATTPVRPVYDASCRIGRHPSLNDCLYKGPNLIEIIPTMLLRFGEHKIGVTADIRKAFQMLMVAEDDKKYQKFLWWEDEECSKMVTYQHNRVVFGITSSPFLLGATIKHHLENYEDQIALKKLKGRFYVDNLVTSVNSMADYNELKKQATEIMASAGMELREWECTKTSNFQNDDDECKTLSVLGLMWNPQEDCLSINLKRIIIDEKVTKRMMLSVVAQIFDPMGYVAPALLLPKAMVQEAWSLKFGWDTPVPEEVSRRFLRWIKELEELKRVKIPRRNKVESYTNSEVHIFCDSSQTGIAAVAFLWTTCETGSKLQFLMCKSRLLPKKKLTIPRSELVSCVIGERIALTISGALEIPVEQFVFWSDSSTALAWIRRAGDWGVFVRNRVKEILDKTKAEQWRHVPGVSNPADLPSRGCSCKFLAESTWWRGPDWLQEYSGCGFELDEEVNEEEVQAEVMKTKTTSAMVQVTEEPPRFSTYRSNVAVWGWVLRFVRKSLEAIGKSGSTTSGIIPSERLFLSITELRQAEKLLLRKIQADAFPDNCSVIGGIQIQKDEDGLLRVKTRLSNRSDTNDFIYPIVLPKVHPLVDQLVRDMHYYHGHGGVQFLLSKLREKYWILQSRRVVRRIIGKCMKCKRHSVSPLMVDPAPLPSRRVADCTVFQTTGVDLAGPLYLKTGEKVWIVLYTCAVYRAIHLDLVRSLSTEDFVLALERFIAEHGRPNTLYSDNGTNFVGAANLFSLVEWESVKRETGAKQIQWIFNPPTAAWYGGWWERLVRSIKDLLKRMLGKARLTYDELRTCLSGVAATINDRPLTLVNEDAMDLIPLTPAMFLRPRSVGHFPDLEKAEGLRIGYRKMKDLQRALQERFRKEYLSLLVSRGGKKTQEKIAVGDVVLVGADNRKRYDWPLGVVAELFPGKDGKTRVVKVKTSAGMFVRPLQRLYPLEVSRPKEKANEPIVNALVDKTVQRTRSGREVKTPSRYGQWMHMIV